MCGIAGFSGEFEATLLRRMNASIAHRGPDDEGTLHLPEARIGLTHRRLSIIDLSVLGRQPMSDPTGAVTLVYNGEIYNFRELRAELVAAGVTFRSQCDTEVLIQLYRREGEAMLSRLNGIFAFALWDARDRSLLLVRDQLGVKPLYYAEPPGGFLFASELKALLQEPTVDRALDPQAIQYHLTYLWAPAPHTMLRAVKKLEPGHAMRVVDGRIKRTWRFYDLPYERPPEPMELEQAIEQTRHHVRQAVERQMVADVQVGAFLSGGLDSSAVAAFAQRSAPAQRLQCFTIAFSKQAARTEGMTLDHPYAERVAKHLDVDLHTITVGPEMVDEVERMVYQLDEPQADPAPINALFISRLARDHGIKVLLSGAGGDDIFTGYRRHYALMQERAWSWLPRPGRRLLAAAARSTGVSRPGIRRVAKAFRHADLDGDERLASYFYWIEPRELGPLFGADVRRQLDGQAPSLPLLRSLQRLPADTHPLNKMLYLEGKHFLADHNLNYTDKMGMAVGVEVRVPLLDVDLVDFAARLPIDFKQRGREGKWIFKKAMEPLLPRDVIYRPKTGFGAPLRHWLKDELRPMVEDVLSERALARRGLFDPRGVRELIARDRAGRTDASYTIFSLICIELWCRLFIDRPAPTPI